ncbi:DUF429 domain-containing protein [Halobium salinum]|uniref:DUF429 domain-containing protein n=1 Tax=Halobium salinum TaxID=1364940 RepID=A0ABD5PH21_9EURY|nr:DUF429 domain-containing protein [Halobium salinum]
MGGGYSPPNRVHGVGFRAGKLTAGDDTWLASCRVDGDELVVESCRSASDALGVRAAREAAVPAVTRFVAGLDGDAAVGFDFPFGLPRHIVVDRPWEGFLFEFPNWFASADDMRERCRMHAELVSGGEKLLLLRATDRPLSAVSPYDERLATETFHGIRDVLRPLVTTGQAVAVPIQEPDPDCPSLLETYPAGTLDTMSLSPPASASDPEESAARRERIVARLADAGVRPTDEVREAMHRSDDALSAVLVAFAAYRNTLDGGAIRTDDEEHVHEGYIYV